MPFVDKFVFFHSSCGLEHSCHHCVVMLCMYVWEWGTCGHGFHCCQAGTPPHTFPIIFAWRYSCLHAGLAAGYPDSCYVLYFVRSCLHWLLGSLGSLQTTYEQLHQQIRALLQRLQRTNFFPEVDMQSISPDLALFYLRKHRQATKEKAQDPSGES